MTTATVKQLRAITGAGPLDCKNALAAYNGDLEQAAAYLREKGLAKAALKAGRETRAGLVVVRSTTDQACVLEVNCETDFVASTNDFKTLVHGLAEQILTDASLTNVEAVLAAPQASGKTNADAIQELIGRLGENITVGRLARFSGGIIESYIHSGELNGFYGPLEGRIGVLVQLSASHPVDREALLALAHDLALHIVSARPLYLDGADPEVSLMQQAFVKNDRIRVVDLIQQKGRDLGTTITVEQFACFEIGA
jgi:elongation factor Ts